MRHFSVEDISKFIIYVNENELVKSNYNIENYFELINNVTIENIKEYYLILLKKCKKAMIRYIVIFKKRKEEI